MATTWERLADRLLKRWRADELILLEGPAERLREDLADFLAGRAGLGTDGAVIADWLLDREDVEDVLCDDETLTATLAEEAREVAKELDSDAGEETDDGAPDEEREQRIDARVPGLVEQFGRRPYRPRVEAEDGSPTATKFGGTPLLGEDEPWPACENCGEPMHLMAQIDLATIPDGARAHDQGLVQLFYCTSADPPCEADCQADSPGAGSTLVRWLDDDAPREVDDDERPVPPHPDFEPSRVVAWVEGPAELPDLGENDELKAILDAEEIDHTDLFERDLCASDGDKLGGWPAWVSEPRYPRCPDCSQPMRYLLQLKSDGLGGHVFGDGGRGHLFQCADHAEYVAFSWR